MAQRRIDSGGRAWRVQDRRPQSIVFKPAGLLCNAKPPNIESPDPRWDALSGNQPLFVVDRYLETAGHRL